MKILVKEIDLYKSVINRKQYVSKYLIYLMYEDTLVSAYIEYGEDSKNRKIQELDRKYQITNNITNEYLIN